MCRADMVPTSSRQDFGEKSYASARLITGVDTNSSAAASSLRSGALHGRPPRSTSANDAAATRAAAAFSGSATRRR